MQLSAALLLCFLILYATGAAGPLCRAVKLRAGVCAAWAAVLLVLRLFPFSPFFPLTLNPAALLAACLCCALAANEGARPLCVALGCAVCAGLGMLVAGRLSLLPAEPALPLAGIAALCALTLLRTPYCALCCAAFAPLCMELWAAALELYAFGYATLTLGSTRALNAQSAAVFLTLLAAALYAARRARRAAPRPSPENG